MNKILFRLKSILNVLIITKQKSKGEKHEE